MKIICLVKFVPDVNNFLYDYEKNVLVRENMDLILNPDDSCALAFALSLKKSRPDVFVEVVTMAPMSIREQLKDIVRIKADRAVLLSDRQFQGSDTYATSRIIGAYLKEQDYDLVLTGSHSLDGDTAHVPFQLAELLDVDCMSHIIHISEASGSEGKIQFTAEYEQTVSEFEVALPAVLGVSKDSKYKLPFVRYKDLDLDVDDQIVVLSNRELKLSAGEIGLQGSLTKVKKTYRPEFKKKESVLVQNDEAGIETVYQFLKEKGFL